MYDWPEVAWATDALWRAISRRLDAAGIAAPEALDRSRPFEEVWRDPGLVLSQTCGFPYATWPSGTVHLVATPITAVEGCEGPFYSSLIVARRSEQGGALADFAGRRVAFNSRDSLSGYVTLVAALRAENVDPDDYEWIETGSHRASIRAMAETRADIAAIDAVCWALATRYEPEAVARLARIGQTALRPAPPFITAGSRGEAELEDIRRSLSDALASGETAAPREALRVVGVEVLNTAAYDPLADLMR
jgi:ABC-type phosphate/phosphonate transport system substrate-binding protein